MRQKKGYNLVLIRHTESEFNKRKELTKSSKRFYVGISVRNEDVQLTENGRTQAKVMGVYLRNNFPKFDFIFHSPYRRATLTKDLIFKELGYDLKIIEDERLREKDFGIIDGLTKEGIKHFYPYELKRRELVKKYYYRPPGGESYPDVGLRVRSFLDMICSYYSEKNILVICHNVVILMFRKWLEHLSEPEVLRIDGEDGVKIGSLTWYCYQQGEFKLQVYNFIPQN